MVLGDVFGRGSQVVECLWLLFELELQATKAGGRLHLLMGNHDYMVLLGDTRYSHAKYRDTAQLLQTDYHQLFYHNTVLGRWLRSKPTVIKINQSLFVHAGLSESFSVQFDNLTQINQQYAQALQQAERHQLSYQQLANSSKYKAFFDRYSPIWYRGYFASQFEQQSLYRILQRYQVQQIIVGHTSLRQISAYYQGLLYAIDSSIKRGQSGEVLCYQQQQWYRGTFSGERFKLLSLIHI